MSRFVKLDGKAVEAGLVHTANMEVTQPSCRLLMNLLATFFQPMIVELSAQDIVGDRAQGDFEGLAISFQFHGDSFTDLAIEG